MNLKIKLNGLVNLIMLSTKKQELNELDTHTFTPEKVMPRRDIEKQL